MCDDWDRERVAWDKIHINLTATQVLFNYILPTTSTVNLHNQCHDKGLGQQWWLFISKKEICYH